MVDSFRLDIKKGIKKAKELGADGYKCFFNHWREVGGNPLRDIKETVDFLKESCFR